jgi:hypothetical protein
MRKARFTEGQMVAIIREADRERSSLKRPAPWRIAIPYSRQKAAFGRSGAFGFQLSDHGSDEGPRFVLIRLYVRLDKLSRNDPDGASHRLQLSGRPLQRNLTRWTTLPAGSVPPT